MIVNGTKDPGGNVFEIGLYRASRIPGFGVPRAQRSFNQEAFSCANGGRLAPKANEGGCCALESGLAGRWNLLPLSGFCESL
jgi:hypothetical protein